LSLFWIVARLHSEFTATRKHSKDMPVRDVSPPIESTPVGIFAFQSWTLGSDRR
jgi:hypothetical protein